MDYTNPKLFIFLKEIIVEAGEIAIMIRKQDLLIKYKSDHTPVTNADILTSNFIYQKLKDLDPSIPVISEEFPYQDVHEKENRSIFWLVDPIDGTKNFIQNKEDFTINIALVVDSMPVIGFVYKPTSKELYYTDHDNELCFEKNGHVQKDFIQTIHRKKFIALLGSDKINLDTEFYIKKYNIGEIKIISSSIKLCLIAQGIADVYPKFGDTMQWDIAAGHAIINSTGGRIIDLSHNEIFYGVSDFHNNHLIAMNGIFFKKFYKDVTLNHSNKF